MQAIWVSLNVKNLVLTSTVPPRGTKCGGFQFPHVENDDRCAIGVVRFLLDQFSQNVSIFALKIRLHPASQTD